MNLVDRGAAASPQEGLGLRDLDGGRSWHWCPMAQLLDTPRVSVHFEVSQILDDVVVQSNLLHPWDMYDFVC